MAVLVPTSCSVNTTRVRTELSILNPLVGQGCGRKKHGASMQGSQWRQTTSAKLPGAPANGPRSQALCYPVFRRLTSCLAVVPQEEAGGASGGQGAGAGLRAAAAFLCRQWCGLVAKLWVRQHNWGFIPMLIWQKDLSYVVASPGGLSMFLCWSQHTPVESLGFSGGFVAGTWMLHCSDR